MEKLFKVGVFNTEQVQFRLRLFDLEAFSFRNRYGSSNLSLLAFILLPFHTPDFVSQFEVLNVIFSDSVVLAHSKHTQLFNNIPSTIAGEGQWPHPTAEPTIYRLE